MQKSEEKQPLSPHLQIYKLPLVSILSVSHRLTGVILFLSFILFWYILNYRLINGDVNLNQFNLDNQIVIPFVWLFHFALSYHLLNGIRHLFWDKGYFLSLRSINITNIAVLVGTILLTISIPYRSVFILLIFLR
ncbi:MAG: succinate dehydrogenase, cytochrome b556 subunit [Rickettsiaceae bacterium H1]|nr:succinate dehydrogenase, cytochrome b556 subunit [Rickettsiaceae bacterium H1]